MGEALYERQVWLPAPPERVFWYLLNPGHVASYDSHLRSWQPREWPPRVGTRTDFEAKLGPVWLSGVSEIVAFDPPTRLALRQVSPPSPFRSRMTWDLMDRDGGALFAYRFEVSSPPGLGWVGGRLLRLFTGHLDAELPALAGRF